MFWYKTTSLIATIGILLIFTIIIISFPHYVGFLKEDYSFQQHFISELGNPYKNKQYHLLNYGFMVIGFLFIPKGIMLSYHTRSKIGYLAGVFGFLAMLALCLVGYFPEHHVDIHTPIALTFFALASLSVLIYSILSLTSSRMNTWLFIPSLLPALLFTIFLFYPKIELKNIVSDPFNYVRPDIVWLAVLEWLFFVSMSFWVLCSALFLWKQKKN